MRVIKRLFNFSLLVALISSCLNENGIEDMAKPSTFVRYFYGGIDDRAVSIEETVDKGFIFMSNITFNATVDMVSYAIKLTKTDQYGNLVWSKIYPTDNFVKKPTGELDNQPINYSGSNLQILSNEMGYLIVGSDIKSNGIRNILVMTVNTSGDILLSKSINSSVSTTGVGIAINKLGNYVVLGSEGNDQMSLTQLQSADLTVSSKIVYSAGSITLNNKLFIDQNDKVLWASTVQKENNTLMGIRFIRTIQNSISTDYDIFYSDKGSFRSQVNDFCRFGYDYALVGSSNKKNDVNFPSDYDILFKRISSEGAELVSKTYSSSKTGTDNQNDSGNSIISTNDGGLIILASINSVAIEGRGDDDYMLLKIDAFGVEQWRSTFGSRFKDSGVAIRQVAGGYIVLGTSTQGGLNLISLIKTDEKGKIE